MATVLPNYEYDIFISYRQKDNNLDGWVTEFVHTLKNEIDATFKEDISIYFDENPHDGLLETHDVDLSLKEKIKAIIFIPIISQTYCDPNCFAWQKEFIAFRDFAIQDEIGLDVTVSNGNVAKRILPIKIHELDPADKELYEKEVGGIMRSIDFVYKSAGVNRSLRLTEEHVEDNLNKTIYRDQINKVANGIKEIITSVQNPSNAVPAKQEANLPEPSPKRRIRIALPLILTLLVIALMIIFKPWQNFTGSTSPILVDKSIAVLPFEDLSQNGDENYLGEGISGEIINNLKTYEGLTVIGRTSSFLFKGKGLDLITIGETLGVRYLLEGTIQQEGAIIRVGANLINSKNGSTIWTYGEDKEFTSILDVQNEIAYEIAEMFNETRNKPRIIDVSPEVQDLYFQAKYYGSGVRVYPKENARKAVNYYRRAIALDSTFSKAFSGLAYVYALHGYFGSEFLDSPWENAKILASKAAELDSGNYEAYFVQGYIARTYNWDWEKARSLYQKSLSINPNNSLTNSHYGLFLACVNEADSGLYFAKKAYSLEPLDEELQDLVVRLFTYSRSYDEGLRFLWRLDRQKELDEIIIAQYLYRLGDYQSYIDQIKRIVEVDSTFTSPPFEIYENSGIEAFQKAWYDIEIEERGRNLSTRIVPWWHWHPESLDERFKALNTRLDEKRGRLVYLLVVNFDDPLRDDPRFDDVLKRMDLYKYKDK